MRTLLLALAPLVVAGCGSDDDASAAPTPTPGANFPMPSPWTLERCIDHFVDLLAQPPDFHPNLVCCRTGVAPIPTIINQFSYTLVCPDVPDDE